MSGFEEIREVGSGRNQVMKKIEYSKKSEAV